MFTPVDKPVENVDKYEFVRKFSRKSGQLNDKIKPDAV